MTNCTCHPGKTCTSAGSCAVARAVEFGSDRQAPEAMTDEQHEHLMRGVSTLDYGRAVESHVNAMWSERLRAQPAGQGEHWTEREPVRLKESRAGRVYVAGPMTGLPEFNFPAFNAEAAALRAQGFAVLNPADHGIVEGADWADYLRHDIAGLASCERIHLLPGWSNSKGAKLEMHIAQTLGMTVTFADGAEPTQPAGQAGGEPVGDRAALVDELIRCAGRRDVLHQQYMGKAMGDAAYAEFTSLRDERIPELRAKLAAPQQQAGGEVVAWQFREARDDGTWGAWVGCDKQLAASTWREVRGLCVATPAPEPEPKAEPVPIDVGAICYLATEIRFAKSDDVAQAVINKIRAKLTAATQAEPVPMVLHCPKCGMQHIDAPENADVDHGHVISHGWDNPPHRSHLCHGCGTIWRPADVPTTGVVSITTKGKADTWEPGTQAEPVRVPEDVQRDAERYRWLRDVSVPPHNFYLSVPDEFDGVRYAPAEVDAYIDAATLTAAQAKAKGGA